MNIPQNQVALLMEFGYTEPEARFLYVVATHSGYFILRQFLNFTGARRGKRSNLFARKVLNNGHGSVRDYLGYGSIYHLFSRTLYGQIEKGNLRNRRKHSFEYIRTRLVLLDFILANPEAEYLETEQDKVTFFRDKLGVAKEFLPGRLYEGGPGSRPTLRYFVDKFPLFIAAPLLGAPPVVTMSFVDSGLGTIASFLTHLAAYQPLFRQLQAFRFLYISPTDAQFARATERFRAVVKQPLESDSRSRTEQYNFQHDPYVAYRFVGGEIPLAISETAGAFSVATSLAGEAPLRGKEKWFGGVYGLPVTLVAVGGDFQHPERSKGTAAFTVDGGQHWTASTNPPARLPFFGRLRQPSENLDRRRPERYGCFHR